MVRRLAIICSAALISAVSPAAAATGWGGLTAPQAIARVKADLVRQGLRAGDITPSEGAALIAGLERMPVHARRVTRYHGKRFWIVSWTGTPYEFCVDHAGLDLYCSIGEVGR